MAVQTSGNTEYIIATTRGRVYAGLLDGGSMQLVGDVGNGFLGDCPEIAILNDPIDLRTKAYGVDGDRSRVIDVAGNTVTGWVGLVSRRTTGHGSPAGSPSPSIGTSAPTPWRRAPSAASTRTSASPRTPSWP